MPFKILFAPDARDQIKHLSARDRSIIVDAVDIQLTYQPNVPTRNRKPLRPNNLATWELRIGEYRVYYDLDGPEHASRIVALGKKDHAKVWINGKEYWLS